MTKNFIDVSGLRKEYTRSRLHRADLTAEPIDFFKKWLKQACEAQLPNATAMCVSTVDKNCQPHQRLVLLKHFDRQSMVFYTNFNSKKAMHLAHNPSISLHFSWHSLERQVLVLGYAEPLSIIKTMKYFHSRPRNSKISSWVSRQSSLISDRSILENKFLKLKKIFAHVDVPLPSFWGGYKVIIHAMEFWQGGAYRLHDRFLYQRKENGWIIDRLAP